MVPACPLCTAGLAVRPAALRSVQGLVPEWSHPGTGEGARREGGGRRGVTEGPRASSGLVPEGGHLG